LRRRVRRVASGLEQPTHFRLIARHFPKAAFGEFLLARGLLVLGIWCEPLAKKLEVSTARREHAAVGVVHAQKAPPFFDGRIGSLEYHLRPESEDLATVRRFTAYYLHWVPSLRSLASQRFEKKFGQLVEAGAL
jgi:hypothetical protein